MDRGRFDDFAIAISAEQTRRRVFGGGLAALLAAAGLGAADDAAAAKSCAKKCKKKNSNKARKKCKKKCQRNEGDPFSQTGSAVIELQSQTNCENEGECVDLVTGEFTGTPIAAGEFSGELTGTNFRDGAEPGTTDVDYAGTLVATETGTGDSLNVDVDLTLTRDNMTGDFSFAGSFEIDGGTGRFAGATGSGTASGLGTRPGADGTVEEFNLEGEIKIA